MNITECTSCGDANERGSEEVEGKEEEKGSGTSGDYELMMAVGHVKEAWMEVPGNLVVHIKVGPSYHLRKEARFACISHITGISLKNNTYNTPFYTMI